ncbi:MAG: alpha/beta fold hydrolase [Nodosilinea sp.]
MELTFDRSALTVNPGLRVFAKTINQEGRQPIGTKPGLWMLPMSPDFILFAQHGWADNHQTMQALAQKLATQTSQVVAPCLNYASTWLRLKPLVERVERLAAGVVESNPGVPLRIVGHSMGGLIWLQVLARHPDWWPRVDSLVLLAVPVGGAHLARLVDPLGLGVGIAADLGRNHRPTAIAIVARIKTLVLAGDIDGGGDGTITIESTKIPQAQFQVLEGLSHPVLRYHPQVIEIIRRFWAGEQLESAPTHPLIEYLRQVPGITDAHYRGFKHSVVYRPDQDGVSLRRWGHPLGLDHVFVASMQGDCLYGGYVGWLHRWHLAKALAAL